MKRIYLTAILLFITLYSFAQLTLSDTSSVVFIKSQLRSAYLKKKGIDLANSTPPIDNLLPNLVPPSPTAAALGKYTDFPVNIYNGVPSVSIPIHQLKSRNITVPITLNYHASGVKVGEVASNCGLGWGLDAGGLITRSVRGLPDETPIIGFFETRNHYLNPDVISFSGISNTIWQKDLAETAKGKTDFEQDMYILNAMGRSFKLIFKSNGTILTVPYSDLKISVNFTTDTWEIILEDGTKLVFGGNGATEVSDLIVGQSPNAELYTFDSSWYLKSITSHQADVVNFSYTYSAITNNISFAESDNFKIIDNYQPPFNTVIDIEPLKTTYKDQTIAALSLNSITSDNETVNFVKQSIQREDLLGDYALSEIQIIPKNGTIATETYQFKYHYVDATSSVEYNPLNKAEFRKRLQLDTLARLVNGTLYQPWVFGYNSLALPSRRSYAQDHWGFYNGATNNTTLLPNIHATVPTALFALAGLSTTDWGFFPPKHTIGANREPDSVSMQAQILTSIQYPTGGKTVFRFEANKVPLTETVYLDDVLNLAINTNDTPFQYVKSYSFINTKPQYVKITFQGHFSNAFLEDLGDNTGLCSVALNQQNSIVNSWGLGVKKSDLDGSNNFSFTRYVSMQELNYYSFILNVVNNGTGFNPNDFTLSASFSYQVSDAIPPTTKLVGGLRLAQSIMYDGLGQKASQRLFQYADPFVINPISLSEYLETTHEVVCGGDNTDPTYNILSRTSNTKYALGSIQGGTVGYGTVTTLTDSLGTNGKTISIFSNEPDDGTAESKIFPYPATNPRDYKRGLLLSQTDYKADSNKVKEVTSEYAFIPKGSISGVKSGFLTYYGACATDAGTVSLCNDEFGYCGVAATFSTLSTEQVNKTKTIERIYGLTDANYTEITIEYEYGNPDYTQITKTISTEGKSDKITVNSVAVDNRTIETTFKYPYDFTTALYSSMTTKNIIAPVIEKTAKLRVLDNEGTPTYTILSEEKTTFDTFGTSPNNLNLPQKIETRINGTLGVWITPVEFQGYDSRGNLTKYYQRNGQTTTLTYYGATDYGKSDLVQSISVGGGSTGTELARSMNYDYLPLIGLSMSSDVNGYLTKYAFDEFNRLKSVKDNDDYLLKDFRYHYRNETNPTGIGVNANSELNFVLSRIARTEQTGTDLSNSVDLSSTQIQYMDGLGRELQTLLWRANPDKTKDILVSTTAYNALGQAYKGILPTPSDAALGVYKANAQSLASAFYDGDTYPYSETVFEPSPLNRPQKVFGAGQNWRVTGNEKFTEISYRIAGTEVLQFNKQADGSIKGDITYPSSSLLNNLTVSERGFWTIELKDRQGKVTHKFQQLQTGFVFAITAYCYDDLGRLIAVIPPEAYKKFGNETGQITSVTESDEIFKELFFGYHYDNIGRISEKHIPGAGWRYSVYDQQDREVMFADDADKAKGYWQFRKFDALSRIIQAGILNGIGTTSRQTLQTAFDDFTGQSYETTGADLLGYTNKSFPMLYKPAEADIMNVKYYDDYVWQTETAYDFNSSTAFHTQGLTKALLTGELKRNLKTGTWQKKVIYYDYKGRVIQDFHLTNRANLIRKENQYLFNGELLKTRYVKTNGSTYISTKIFTWEYDHLSRKTKFNHFLNGVEKTIATYSYDDIGRMFEKLFNPRNVTASLLSGSWNSTTTWQNNQLPTITDNIIINSGHTVTINAGESGSAGSLFLGGVLNNFGSLHLGNLAPSTGSGTLQTLIFKYHIRGGLKGINLDANNNLTDNLFSYKLDYEDDGTLFDGNIRKQTWKSNIDGKERSFVFDYDGAFRLKSGIYNSKLTGEDYSLNQVDYDFNGNITGLSRSGATNANFTNFGNVDNLSYSYQSQSNRLSKIADATTSNDDLGDFRDGTNTDDDYDYWLDGSLKKDKNKKISLSYNYLKLPETITFDNGRTITTEYDAAGTKLKKIDSNGETTDYEEDDIYVNSVLYQTAHDEGRINSQGQYEYNITDHLGNLRVVFRDSSGIAVPVQSVFYDPWGLSMKGMATTRNTTNFNKFQYNGKETQLETGFIDLGNRSINPTTGRMLSIDRFAEKYVDLSAFQFAGNNPIRNIDINGDSLFISFKNQSYLYDAGNLYLNGSVYTGKVKGFLKDVVNALKRIGSGQEGASMIAELQGSKNVFNISEGKSQYNEKDVFKSHANQFQTDPANSSALQAIIGAGRSLTGGSGGTISWNTSGAELPTTNGGQINPITDLAHEMFHALDSNRGLLDDRRDNGVKRDEWQAVYRENILRGQLNEPLRTHYIKSVDSSGNFIGGTGVRMITPTNQPLLPTWYKK